MGFIIHNNSQYVCVQKNAAKCILGMHFSSALIPLGEVKKRHGPIYKMKLVLFVLLGKRSWFSSCCKVNGVGSLRVVK